MAADEKLFVVYQDWVHQNTGTHLDVGIEEDVKWQQIRENIIFLPTQRYGVLSSWVRKRVVATITVELDIIRNRQWKAERVINFQMVIL